MKSFRHISSFAALLLSCILLLLGCKNKTSSSEAHDPRFIPIKYDVNPILHPTSYIGDWSYSFPFYHRGLSVKSDGTFSFEEGGCTGRSYSEGTWTNDGARLVLKSHEEFATKDSLDFLSFNGKTYFEFVSLSILGDTLYELDKNGFRTDIRYVLVRKDAPYLY